MGSRLSADRINQMVWLDANCGTLPPQPRGFCGTISNRLPSQESQVVDWHAVSLNEPVPVYPGQYKIRAILAFDWEVNDRLTETQTHSTSDEVVVFVDDNLSWKDRLIHFDNCDYDDVLDTVPDADAVGALSRHLGDCAATWDTSIAQILHRIVWLKMQVEQPDLYSRMMGMEKGHVEDPGDPVRIHNWFRDQYRLLLLETARQLVAKYKAHPELRGDQDFQEDVEGSFENWHDAAASLCGGPNNYLSRAEVMNFLRQAGRSQRYIDKFFRERKSDIPLDLPHR